MARSPKNRLIAVIDIGSNSVRLVVFRGLKRSPDNIFNERVLCGLAAGVSRTGRMAEAAMEMALAELRRFAHLCRDMQVDQIEAVATAAVRDSENGPEFVERIEQQCGFKVRVLPGKKEAKLSAYGVLSGFPGAEGIVADLGGGSLELALLQGGRAVKKKSLPIGPLRLLEGAENYRPEHVRAVVSALQDVGWLKDCKGLPLYMVGGSWRAISHIHILESKWPLHVLHGYRLGGNIATEFSAEIAARSLDSLKGLPGIAPRRAVILPLSARILNELLKIITPSIAYTSAYGLREGLLYKSLSHKVRLHDPLIAHARDFGDRTARFKNHGELLSAWMDPVFSEENETDRRLRQAACHISDICWNAHPDFKADLAFSRALVMRYVGITHPERVLVALALFVAYGGVKKSKAVKKVCRISKPQEIDWAVALGLAIRLGLRLTGGTGEPLKKTSLLPEKKKLVLAIPEREQDLNGEVVQKRLSGLATHLGLKGEVRITP